MTEPRRKVSFVRLWFNEDHVPEYSLFDGIPGFDVTFVGYKGPKIYGSDTTPIRSANYIFCDIQRLMPGLLTRFFLREPPSAVSYTRLRGIQSAIEDSDVVVAPEMFSIDTFQIAAYCSRAQSPKMIVEVWETLSSLPLHYLPPHSVGVARARKVASRFLAHTLTSARYLRSLGIAEGRISVVYPGIDLNLFKPAVSKIEVPRILFVGRMDKEKGLESLLRAFIHLINTGVKCELWVRAKRGAGELSALVESLTAKYPIRFFGFLRREELATELYGEASILCLPSHDRKKFGVTVWEEQFGFVLMEALACGLPIVGTDCGAIPEVLGPDNFVVPQKDASALVTSLRLLVEDEKLRERLSIRNRRRAEEMFDLKRQRTKLGKVLEQAMEAH